MCVAGPSGEWMEQPQERPQAVSVKMLDSSTAAVSWAPSAHRYNGSLISVLSLTCLRPSISQRMENTYCSEVPNCHSPRFLRQMLNVDLLRLFNAAKTAIYTTRVMLHHVS